MRDMYEVLDRWGPGLQQITVVWTGSLLLQGLKVYYLMERKHANNAMMMKES